MLTLYYTILSMEDSCSRGILSSIENVNIERVRPKNAGRDDNQSTPVHVHPMIGLLPCTILIQLRTGPSLLIGGGGGFIIFKSVCKSNHLDHTCYMHSRNIVNLVSIKIRPPLHVHVYVHRGRSLLYSLYFHLVPRSRFLTSYFCP